MWPINAKQCLKQLKTFNPPSEPKPSNNNKQSLPKLPKLQTPMEVEKGLTKWDKHLGPRCSSPSRPHHSKPDVSLLFNGSRLEASKPKVAKSRAKDCLHGCD